MESTRLRKTVQCTGMRTDGSQCRNTTRNGTRCHQHETKTTLTPIDKLKESLGVILEEREEMEQALTGMGLEIERLMGEQARLKGENAQLRKVNQALEKTEVGKLLDHMIQTVAELEKKPLDKWSSSDDKVAKFIVVKLTGIQEAREEEELLVE